MFPPGSIIGIVGGGQLGRMMAEAAHALGYSVCIFAEQESEPGVAVTNRAVIAPYTDEQALRRFAEQCDVITYEFENIPHASIKFLETLKPVCPGWKAIHTAQHRLREKHFFEQIGVPTNQFFAVNSLAELEAAYAKIAGGKAVLKTVESGYDGKGQAVIKSAADIASAWQSIGQHPSILEAFVPYVKEISVITARTEHGITRAFPPAENTHRNGVLDTSVVPATVSEHTLQQARVYAGMVAEGLEAIGVTTVEFFVLENGEVLANEIAPRVHNSGHWTQDGCTTCQFEQHIRAVCGLPLGDVRMLHPVTMKNLLGADVEQWQDYLEQPNAKLHLYGKKHARPGRKMGHVNLLEM